MPDGPPSRAPDFRPPLSGTSAPFYRGLPPPSKFSAVATMTGGFIVVDRAILHSAVWPSPGSEYSRMEALLDLVLRAQWGAQAHRHSWGSAFVEVQRGELLTSWRDLQQRWGRSRGWRERLMQTLERDGVVAVHRDPSWPNGWNLIRIVGYTDRWQLRNSTSLAPESLPCATPTLGVQKPGQRSGQRSGQRQGHLSAQDHSVKQDREDEAGPTLGPTLGPTASQRRADDEPITKGTRRTRRARNELSGSGSTAATQDQDTYEPIPDRPAPWPGFDKPCPASRHQAMIWAWDSAFGRVHGEPCGQRWALQGPRRKDGRGFTQGPDLLAVRAWKDRAWTVEEARAAMFCYLVAAKTGRGWIQGSPSVQAFTGRVGKWIHAASQAGWEKGAVQDLRAGPGGGNVPGDADASRWSRYEQE